MAAFDMVARRLEALKSDQMQRINADIFRAISVAPLHPSTWRERLQTRRRRVRGYVVTLWAALRGDDPYDTGDDW